MPKARDLIANVLEEAGIEFVFGLPGGGTVAIYDSLFDKRKRIQSILVRHEQAAAIMADAYGRATGRPAVIMGQGAFMGSNATFGIMEAFMSSSPMVVLTDTSDGGMAQHPANQSVAGEHGSVDLMGIFRAMTKYTTLATTPKEAVIGTQLAIKHSLSGRPGPTAVVMRSSSINGEVDTESPPFIHPTKGYLSAGPSIARTQDVEHAAALLVEAKHPVIVAGNGVHLSDAHPELRQLAGLLGSPVATSYKGKSAIAETDPLSVGMIGVFGQDAANSSVAAADVILVVGARLTPQDTAREDPAVFNPKRQHIIQIDIDPRNAGWTFPVEIGLVGEAKEILGQLVAACSARLPSPGWNAKERVASLQAHKKQARFFDDPSLDRDSNPVLPQRMVRLMQEALEPSAMITLDAGNNRVWMCHFYQTQTAKTCFAPGGLAGMGWAMPAALGLKLAFPRRQAVAVTGDGGFMMSVHAIQTAIQYKLPVLFVVMNDSALGMVRQHQGDRAIASEFGTVDHGAVARGFGAFGVQIRDSRDLPGAFREALAFDGPAVIDVVIDQKANIDEFRFAPRLATET